MRILLPATLALLALATLLPAAEATGGSQSFRVLANIDAFLVGLSSSCPAGNNGLTCVLLRDNLGYDGLSGGATNIPTHLTHAFSCAITSSAVPTAGAPTDPSMWVGFDLNGDGQSDIKYGGRTTRPGVGQVTGELQRRANNLDAVGVATFPLWYAGQINYNGPSPSVAGNVDGATLIIWLESGLDTTIDCVF